MMGVPLNCCEGLKCDMENKGDELLITLKGDKEKVEKAEKKLKALRELCCSEDGESCC